MLKQGEWPAAVSQPHASLTMYRTERYIVRFEMFISFFLSLGVCLRVDCVGSEATAAAGTKPASDPLTSSSAVVPQSANVVCPDGCKKDQCLSLSGGGFWCNECVTGLMLNSRDGTCGCPAGKFSAAGADQEVQCADCPKGNFCRGGSFETAIKVPCGDGLTTVGQRATAPTNCGEPLLDSL
jgi:hypothetical protein